MLLAPAMIGGLICQASAAPPGYFLRTWQVESGLPQNKVTAIVQTHDGYLWLGTYNGLARFDGVHFTVFDDNNTPQLRSSRITSLCEAQDGTLWIGDESGQITQYKNEQFAVAPFHPKWSGGKIFQMAADKSGDVWLMNEAGELARLRDGMVLTPESGPVTKVVAMSPATDGTIWVQREGAISLLQQGQLSAMQLNTAYIQGICASQDGGLWVAGDLNIREWKDGKWIKNLGATPWGAAIVSPFMQSKNGVLVAGTSDNGLYLIFTNQTANSIHFDRTNGFPSDWVMSLWEDHEGNVWSGTGAGLVMLRPNNLQTISPPDQWQKRAVLSVLADTSDALWIGTEGAGLYRYKDDGWTNFGSGQGIRNPYIWSLAEDADGRLFAGTWGAGLYMEDGGAFRLAPGMTNLALPMPALLSGSNDMWIGTTEGLLHYQNSNATWFATASGKFLDDVRAIARDKQGGIWVGTAGNGLAYLKNQTLQQFKKANGLSSDFIECLHFEDDGTLWIGTFGGGLNRLKEGHFSVIKSEQGLPNNVICDIEEDRQGFFWISSYDGIIRASKIELNRCADGTKGQLHCLTYGINDGLPTLECSEGLQPAGCRTADGRLWFPTAKGLVAVDPAKVILNSLPPPVIIEEVRVDDRPLTIGALGAAPSKIPPGRHRFDFQYTALSFISPEKMQFKYRLTGLDNAWINAGTKRLASYDYIPPGSYSFQVIACNNDDVWNQTGASIAFSILPFFWQTMWFRFTGLAALLAISGGAVWFDTRRRMNRKLEQAERQRDIERERTRIARDIHDDLGSRLTSITMISESARAEIDHPDQVAKGLGRIYDTARELTRSMDEIVWALSPRHDTLESYATYFEKFAQDWLTTAGLRCRLDLPVQFPEWPLTSEIRHNLFLSCKEALHNVVKHSGASEVCIRLVIDKMAFELSIEDNGCGFSQEAKLQNRVQTSVRQSSGNGLENMCRRLSEIGGTCDIQSQPSKGTKVTFIVRHKSPII